MLVRASSDYAYVAALWAALVALAAPWPLIALTQLSVQRIFLAQLLLFVVATLVLSWMPMRILLVPRAIKRAQAHRAATEQFLARGLTRTRDRTGVLVFLSLAERYARIIADQGIAAKVKDQQWQTIVDDLIRGIRSGGVAAALVVAIDRCGAVLATHAPRSDPQNELPDRLYVL